MNTLGEGIDSQVSGQPPDSGCVRLAFVRHAEPADISHDMDPRLTTRGWRQAHALAARLNAFSFSAIYISPLRRAMETAQPLLVSREDVPVHITADLCEVLKEHVLIMPGRASNSIRQILEQERDAMLRFINRVRHSHDAGQRVLIVAHGNLIRALVPMFGGKEPAASILLELNHASLSILDLCPNAARAVLMLSNGTRHLAEADVTV